MSSLGALYNRLPEWARSARFRLALLYSSTLFLLAAVLVATLYFALLASVRGEPLSRRYVLPQPGGAALIEDTQGPLIITSIREFETLVNKRTLKNLKDFSFAALGTLFVASLGVGWVISGRVLAPIDRITSVASEIEATDLARRIRLEGPHDELKRLADTFDRMLERLDDAFSMQRRFVADASHELRNPLAVIRANLDVALSDPRASEEELRQAAEVARRAVERMTRLVDDLLALARLESPHLSWERFDLSGLVDEVLQEEAPRAREMGIALAAGPTDAALVSADREAVKRAFSNLLDNALLYSPRGTSVAVACGTTPDGWSWLAVKDQGPGVPPEHQERIFERFYRIDSSRSRAMGGSGLGLAIVRQIAEAHGGRAGVSSEPGAGATFFFYLPGADVATGGERPPEGAPL